MLAAKEFGPQSFSAEIEAKISGNGWDSAVWSGDDKYDKLDAFLEEARCVMRFLVDHPAIKMGDGNCCYSWNHSRL